MIVLYNPFATPSATKPLPMSLLALAAMLEGEFDYTIVDGNLCRDALNEIDALARGSNIDAIGITVMPGPQLEHAVRDSRLLKRKYPRTPIIWGGYFPSQHFDITLKDRSVDYCVHGQGELTFIELLRALKRGEDPGAIKGLALRRDDSIVFNGKRPLARLDDLPDWPYHKVDIERHLHNHYLGRRVADHHSSFGCPFACSFCAVVEMSSQRWQPQSPRIVEQVARFFRERHGADAIQFHDMDFFISERRVAEISDRFAALDLSWWALGRVDELMRYRDATWQAMKKSGLKMFFCGAESGSDEMLGRMNKGGTSLAEQTLELAERAARYGVIPEFSFVVGNPPDPVGDTADTFRFIRKLKRINPAAEIIIYAYTPVPHEGNLYQNAKELGFSFPDTLDEWINESWRAFSLRRDPNNPWLDGTVTRQVRDFERVINAYFPTATDRKLTRFRRAMLRSFAAWRYHSQIYGGSVELKALQKLFRYQRPETTGF